jgi:hypothetical protein
MKEYFESALTSLSCTSDEDGGCRGHDRMVVGFTTTYAISTYYHWCCEFEPCSWRCVLNILCDTVCQWLAAGRWFSTGTSDSSTNKTDRHDITEKLLKMALDTITLALTLMKTKFICFLVNLKI